MAGDAHTRAVSETVSNQPRVLATLSTTVAVRRVDFGYFVRPATETGTGQARLASLFGYLVFHPAGLVLFDTGMGMADTETETHYRPHRTPLADALDTAGVGVEDVRWVINCHLHFDHCGGNSAFVGRPVIVQSVELESSRQPGYTIPEVATTPDRAYLTIDGELELLPGCWVIPTPGHTPGHQSLVVRCNDGTVVVAGQAHDTATEFTADLRAVVAHRAKASDEVPPYPGWMERILRFDPRRVVFAHDLSIVEPLP